MRTRMPRSGKRSLAAALGAAPEAVGLVRCVCRNSDAQSIVEVEGDVEPAAFVLKEYANGRKLKYSSGFLSLYLLSVMLHSLMFIISF